MMNDSGGSVLAAKMAGVLGFLVFGGVMVLLGGMASWAGHGNAWYLTMSLWPFGWVGSCEGVIMALGYWGFLGAMACLSDVGLFKWMFRAGIAVSYAGLVWVSVEIGLPLYIEWVWVGFYLAGNAMLWMVHWRLSGTGWLTIRKKVVVDKNVCRHCGYDLRGTVMTQACPECGRRRV